MIGVSYRKSEDFVESLRERGVDVRWDGWSMVFFKPHRKARRSINGRYHNGQWGFETVVSPNKHGKWLIKKGLLGE